MYAALAMHPDGPETAAGIVLRILGKSEAERSIKGGSRVNIRREQVDVVNSQGLCTMVEGIVLVDGLKPIHLAVELQRSSPRILDAESTAHKWTVGPLRSQPLGAKVRFRTVKVVLFKHLETENLHGRRAKQW